MEEDKELLELDNNNLGAEPFDPLDKYLHINAQSGAMEWAKVSGGGGGKGISTIHDYYQATETESAPTKGEGEWQPDAIPSDYGASKPFLWGYEVFKYSDDTTYSTPVCLKGRYSKDGKSISTIYNYYQATSTSQTPEGAPTPPEEAGLKAKGWKSFEEAKAEFSSTNKYFWQDEFTYFTDGTWSEGRVSLIAVWGDKGDKGDRGDAGYLLNIDNQYDSIPCDADGNISSTYAWKDQTQHTVRAFLGTSRIDFEVTATQPTSSSTGYFVYYVPTNVDIQNVEKETGKDFKPWISALNADNGKISYALYYCSALEERCEEVANCTFTAAKLKQGNPLVDHWIGTTVTEVKVNNQSIRTPNSEFINLYAYKQIGSGSPALYSGHWKYKVDNAKEYQTASGESIKISNTFSEALEAILYGRVWNIYYKPGKHAVETETYSQIKEEDIDLTLLGARYTRVEEGHNYVQTGWVTDESSEEASYPLEQIYTENASVTLYPFWEETTSNTEYVVNRDDLNEDEYTDLIYDTITIPVIYDGTDAYAIHIANEFVAIPCDSTGSPITGYDWSGKTLHTVTATYGITDLKFKVLDSIEKLSTGYAIVYTVYDVGYVPGTISTDVQTSYSAYISDILDNNGRVEYTLYKDTTALISSSFKATKNKQGENAGTIWISASADKIKIDKNNDRSPSGDIVFKFYQQIGQGTPTAYEGYYICTVDDETPTADTASTLTVKNTATKSINVQLYDKDDHSILYDTETVSVIIDGTDGEDAFKIDIKNPYDSIPFDSTGVYPAEGYDWKEQTIHPITCYKGTEVWDYELVSTEPTEITTPPTYKIWYKLENVTEYVPGEKDPLSAAKYSPYITAISTDENVNNAKVKYTLYENATAKATAEFTAAKQKSGEKGDPAIDYYIIVSSSTIKKVITEDESGEEVIELTPPAETGITFNFYKTIGSGDPESFDGYYTYSIDDGAEVSGTGTSLIIKDSIYTSITANLIVTLYGDAEHTKKYDVSTVTLIQDGKKGDPGSGNASVTRAVYTYYNTYKIPDDLTVTFQKTPVTTELSEWDDATEGAWYLWADNKLPDCSDKNQYIYTSTQAYQEDAKKTFITGTLNFTIPEIIKAYKKGVDPTEYATFLRLTSGGSQQGIYYSEDDDPKLYVNATYIKTGTLDAKQVTVENIDATNINTGKLNANLITAGALTVQDEDENILFKASFEDSEEKEHVGTVQIAQFKVIDNSLYINDLGTEESVWVSTGTDDTIKKSIGGSEEISGWAFTASDKFGVTNKGDLYASSGTFSGTIKGSTINIGEEGKASETPGSLNIYDTTGILIGKWSQDGISIEKGSIQLGKDAEGNYVFSVDNDGKVIATDITIIGGSITGPTINIGKDSDTPGALYIYDGTSSTDPIGSWTKDGISIEKGSIQLGNSEGTYVFQVTNEGKVTASDITITGGSITVGDNFKVTNEGVLTALSGKIGGWTITDNGLENVWGGTDDKVAIYNGTQGGSYVANSSVFTVGVGGAWPFWVHADGKMHAENAEITGGKIGGFTLQNGAIYNGKSSFDSTTKGIYIGTDGISIGTDTAYIKLSEAGAVSFATINAATVNAASFVGSSSSSTITLRCGDVDQITIDGSELSVISTSGDKSKSWYDIVSGVAYFG